MIGSDTQRRPCCDGGINIVRFDYRYRSPVKRKAGVHRDVSPILTTEYHGDGHMSGL